MAQIAVQFQLSMCRAPCHGCVAWIMITNESTISCMLLQTTMQLLQVHRPHTCRISAGPVYTAACWTWDKTDGQRDSSIAYGPLSTAFDDRHNKPSEDTTAQTKSKIKLWFGFLNDVQHVSGSCLFLQPCDAAVTCQQTCFMHCKVRTIACSRWWLIAIFLAD